ncbi:MAG TPA: arginine--tRNA ligase [Methylomirabilota bacterium]|nr:arginine--tRNA ligase [Methylomirabilota bacterium]
MSLSATDLLTQGASEALRKAGFDPQPSEIFWEVPRDARHGDYATNAAMLLAKRLKRPPRQIADQIQRYFPPLAPVERVEVAPPGFVNVFLSPSWCREALREILLAGRQYGRSEAKRDGAIRLEFVSANPTGPLVIVNARAAAVGDSLARILRSHGFGVQTEYYVNDAGNQFEALARSFEVRIRQALGEDAELPENAYPGEYLIDLARDYLSEHGRGVLGQSETERLKALGHYAVGRILEGQRKTLGDYGVEFDLWTSEQRDVRDAGLPERAIEELSKRGLTFEHDGALWFRATEFSDDQDRVLRKSDGELTYFAVDLAFHHFRKFVGCARVVNLMGPDHHGYVARMAAAMQALGHPKEAFEVLIIQLVTLLREGQPVRMSKRRGEFVLMEELIEEVGRDAARFTFLTRRHDSPLEFDLAVATRQSADNPVYYVQYAHARIAGIFETLQQRRLAVPDWSRVVVDRLSLPEELTLIKMLLQFPNVLADVVRTLEPHRLAYYLQELAGLFHPYYNRNRVISDDPGLTEARLALVRAVALVLENGLDLLGVSAPEKM